ncbi:MAG: hypothetical protein M1818_007405 [Claussenomyces sp. TS43310]|nr:MAG: hypothetical protein M1818_007405 [Claussenomyces sp. TS43310]
MAEYPVTPAFGFDSGRQSTMPVYQRAMPPSQQSYSGGHQDQTPVVESNQATSMAAYMHNGGFPSFSAAAVSSGIPPLPIYQNWNRTLPANLSSAPAQINEPYEPTIQGTSQYSNGNQSFHEMSSSVPQARDVSRAQPVEEGELSEGEYEDVAPIMIKKDQRRPPFSGNRDHYDDYHPEGRDIGRSREARPLRRSEQERQNLQGQTDIYGRSLELSRQRSDSYSPHISPIQTIRVPDQSFSHSDRTKANSKTNSAAAIGSSGGRGPENDSKPEPSSIEQSLREARKEAQGAILNLWPFKVRLEHYLVEGIDEDVVRQQFRELGMLPPMNNVETPPQASENKAPTNLNVGKAGTLLQKTPESHTASKEGKVEERKDRIARLLAEKSKKGTALVVHPETPLTMNSPDAVASASAKADKERLLRQKMETLQKSREARAQKASAKDALSGSATTHLTVQHSAPLSEPQGETLVPVGVPKDSAGLPRKSTSPRTSPSQDLGSKQNLPSIPGLFLARSSSNTPSRSASHILVSASNIHQRKRPVASDFDGPAAMNGSYKRPFGQSRSDQPLVIDVSEEESDDGANETEADHQTANVLGHPTQNGHGMPRNPTMRTQPPLTDLPTRKGPAQGLTSSTPPTPQSAGKAIGKPENLQKKELQIQELKRRIALVEQRTKAKKGMSGSHNPASKISPSGTSTPATIDLSISDKIEASVRIEQLMENANQQVNQDQQKIAEALAVETEQSVELNRTEAEQRRLRRAKIIVDLPLVDAEVEASQIRLAELRTEMAKLEVAVERGLQNKRRLAEEMERLGQEAEEQLQEQKDKLKNLVYNGRDGSEDHPTHSTPTARTHIIEEQQLLPPTTYVTLAEAEVIDKTASPSLQSMKSDSGDHDSGAPASPTSNLSIADNNTGTLEKGPGDKIREVLTNTEPIMDNSTPNEVQNAQNLDAALQSAIASAEAESMARVGSDVEMEDLYAPNPQVDASASISNPARNSVSDDISVNDTNRDVLDRADGESDPYEPPEATPPASDDVPMSVDSPPFSPAPPETSDSSASDLETSAAPAPRRTDEPTDEPAFYPSAYNTASTLRSGQRIQHILGLSADHETTSFTPYESPMKRFRAFRFHPNFLNEVPGGFKSLTYSNNIKPDEEICRYELAGGVCNDETCQFQHFRTMGLADDAILVELGNSAGYSGADRPKFISGLRNILNDLRAKKTKDFKVIAAEIAAYRTKFLGDKSKVLLVEDISV